MLAHPRIDVRLSTPFESVRDALDVRTLVYTGPIDAYFGHRFGPLPYRSLRFEFETLAMERVQPVGTINHPHETDVPYTRVSEFKHLTGQRHAATTIVREYPTAHGDPYYPIPRPENAALFRRYQELADATPDVHFVGRLATYRYYNMDQVVGQALTACRRIATGGELAA
jgi:UDP-galactopyranose mutase